MDLYQFQIVHDELLKMIDPDKMLTPERIELGKIPHTLTLDFLKAPRYHAIGVTT